MSHKKAIVISTKKQAVAKKITPRLAISYRVPQEVEEFIRYERGDTYPVCPRCHISFEREYQNFCDRCGQRLKWTKYTRGEIRIVSRIGMPAVREYERENRTK